MEKKYELWNNLPEEFRLAQSALFLQSLLKMKFHELAFICFSPLLVWPKNSGSHSWLPAPEVGVSLLLIKSVNDRHAESKTTCVTME